MACGRVDHPKLGEAAFVFRFHIADTAGELHVPVGVVLEGGHVGNGAGGLLLPARYEVDLPSGALGKAKA